MKPFLLMVDCILLIVGIASWITFMLDYDAVFCEKHSSAFPVMLYSTIMCGILTVLLVIF